MHVIVPLEFWRLCAAAASEQAPLEGLMSACFSKVRCPVCTCKYTTLCSCTCTYNTLPVVRAQCGLVQ
jgi:hypothetical protein